MEIALHELLATTRQAKSWSIEDVASRLNLPNKTIKALEAGNYACLHGDAFVRAYLRSYGALLELDAADLLERYQGLQQNAVSSVCRPVHTFSIKAQHKKYKTQYGIGLIALVVALLAVFSQKQQTIKPELEAPAVSVVATPAALAEPAKPSIVEAPEEKAPLVETATITETPSMAVLDTSSEAALLKFSFSADCWVKVIDATQQVVFQGLRAANQDLRLEGRAPFVVTLGYAPGVELSYNGQPVVIENNPPSNRIQLVVGKSHS